MSELAASLLLGAITLGIQIVLLGAAPLVAGCAEAAEAVASGRRPASIAAPYVRLRATAAQSRADPADGSVPLAAHAGLAGLALAVVAFLLVPTFATGTLLAPFDDVVIVAFLLAASHWLGLAAGAVDGASAAAPAVVTAVPPLVFALPAFGFVAALASVAGGSTRLDAAITAEGAMSGGPLALLLGALALLALAEDATIGAGQRSALTGPDAAIAAAGRMVQRLVVLDLLAAFALRGTVVATAGGPLLWGFGLLAWFGKLLVLSFALGAARPLRRAFGAPALLGTASLLGLLGAVLLAIGQTLE